MRARERGVVGAREAQVLGHSDQLGRGELARDHVGTAVGRGVVGDEDGSVAAYRARRPTGDKRAAGRAC